MPDLHTVFKGAYDNLKKEHSKFAEALEGALTPAQEKEWKDGMNRVYESFKAGQFSEVRSALRSSASKK